MNDKKNAQSKKLAVILAAGIATGFATLPPSTCLGSTENEKDLLKLSEKLKPITDTQWSQIIGTKSSDAYEIQKGDTLWTVSEKIFGSPSYWPKIWALNNVAMNGTDPSGKITNPHELKPGTKLLFSPGTLSSIPTLKLPDDKKAPVAIAQASPQDADPRSLPPKKKPKKTGTPDFENVSPDLWKPIDVEVEETKKNYDEYGMDSELKVFGNQRLTFKLPVIANETTIPFLGEIVGSRREGNGLSQNEVVFIKSETQDLQVGTTYSVLSDPLFIDEKKSDRTAFFYKTHGEIKILGIKDEMYLGIITKAFDVLKRGDKLYPLLPAINDIKPIPAQEGIEGLVLVDPHVNTWSTGQYNFIHLDRGLEDGIQIGNVFRMYEYHDPVTQDKLTESDMMINGDAIVVHATGQYCTALILRSRNLLKTGDFGVLLTDIKDIERLEKDLTHEMGRDSTKETDDPELDDLDKLDNDTTDAPGRKEKEEIKQLEKWDRDKDVELLPTEEVKKEDKPVEEIKEDKALDATKETPAATPIDNNAQPAGEVQTPAEPTGDPQMPSPDQSN